MDLQAQFGARIRALRRERGMTQEDLAEAIGMSDRTVRNIERGSHPTTLATIGRLAEALGLPVKELFEFPLESGQSN